MGAGCAVPASNLTTWNVACMLVSCTSCKSVTAARILSAVSNVEWGRKPQDRRLSCIAEAACSLMHDAELALPVAKYSKANQLSLMLDVLCDLAGHELQRWKRSYRVQDMAVTHNGALLIVACSDRQIHILRCVS